MSARAMITPRVQLLNRLPGNEIGRHRNWFAEQPNYANLNNDLPAQPSCNLFDQSQPTPFVNDNELVKSYMKECFNDQESNQFDQVPSSNMKIPAYDISLPCIPIPTPIEQLPLQCCQPGGCTQNQLPTGSRNCQSGPVDVEDLAVHFELEKPRMNCLPRVYRLNNIMQPSSVKSATLDDSYTTDFSSNSTNLSCALCINRENCNSSIRPYTFCSEGRWLQCPASDRCPLYDTTDSYRSNELPPCVYEDLRNDYQLYGDKDEQLFEDYLSNEKRKEKSRDAARCRRSMETDIFTELAAALPVSPEQAAHLDKASVMRLAIAYLKVRMVIDSIPAPLAKSESLKQMDELFPKALDGFMLVLSSDGNIIYLSENVSDYLGVSQMDMMGQSVYEYSHPCDHEELRECLSTKSSENSGKRICSFFLRLKCTLTNKGRKVNLKSASYKVIHCTGRLTYIHKSSSGTSDTIDKEREGESEADEQDTGASLVLLGCPIPHPSNIEIPLGRHTFLSKHSLNMKFTYADEMLAEYLGWNSEELMGQSVFEFYHALDNLALDKSFKSLFSKGQCETVAYRFLGKRGGYAWVVTQATLIHCSKQQRPLSVVCVNYVLSGVECEDEVYSARQLAARDTEKAIRCEEENGSADIEESPTTAKVQNQVQVHKDKLEDIALDPTEPQLSFPNIQSELSSGSLTRVKPLIVTSSIFRTAENKSKKESVQLQDGSRKDNTFPRPVPTREKSFIGVQALKDSLAESLKENEEPKRKQQSIEQPSIGRAPFVFQGKPAVEYDPETPARQNRPHVVTRQLFTSIVSQQQQQQEQITCRPPPQTATASIFAPRTEDMSKGFLTFSEDQPGLTMLKDEPEDLTHLAPTAGDVCVPLEDTPFFSDMLDEFILGNDNYCPLLSPGGALTSELRSADFEDSLKNAELGDPPRERSLGDTLADSDPFMYGDTPSSPCSIDTNAVSPPFSKYRQSPEQSIDSVGSQTGGSGAEGLSDDEMLMLGLNDSIGDEELALRAPYIPMSDQDEALDLLISNDMVMWSPPQTADQKSGLRWMVAEKEERISDSSLAQLLKTNQVITRKCNDHSADLVNPTQVLGQIRRKNVNLGNSQWPPKEERPTKRIHTASANTRNDNKRIKCDETAKRRGNLDLENHLLIKRDLSSEKSSSLGSSQLLRRLVSQQTILRNNNNNSVMNEPFKGTLNSGKGNNSMQTEFELDRESDSNSKSGTSKDTQDGNTRCPQNGADNDSTSDRVPQRNSSCSSVLMNLLVSGCDESLMDLRNVPSMCPKSLPSSLSVNLNNHHMVPQCPDSGRNNSSFAELNSAVEKQLSCTFLNAEEPLESPSYDAPITTFDSFDYDTNMSTSGLLLQVESDLFGSLLEHNIV